jgi:putative spermidine/putrescine transport system permease protein
MTGAPVHRTDRLRGLRISRAYVLPLVPVLLFLGVLFIVPVAMLLSHSVIGPDGGWSTHNFGRLLSSGSYLKSLWLTVKISFWTALTSVALSYPLAVLIARSTRSTASILTLAILVPYWAGVLMRTFGWFVMLGRNGVVNALLKSAGLHDAPPQLIYNYSGVMIGMINAYMPLAILVMVSAMKSIDRRLLSAAATLGAGRGQTFWQVYFPLSTPGVVSALLLIFISSLGTFVTPALLGGVGEVMIAQTIIDQVQQVLDWGFAGAVATLLLVTTLVIFGLYSLTFGIETLTGQRATTQRSGRSTLGKRAGMRVTSLLGAACDMLERMVDRRGSAGNAPRPARPGRAPMLWLASALILTFLIAPIVVLVPISFTSSSFIQWPPQGFSVRWYVSVLTSDVWLRAALRSVGVGVLSAVLALAITLPAAIAITRRRHAGQQWLIGLLLAPMIVPHILLAVALFFTFAKLDMVGSDVGLVLGHTVICIPYTLITLMATLSTYDRRLDQAADVLGASTLQRLRFVTLPVIRSGLVAAFLIGFVTSFEELTIAMFVTGGLSATLPKQLWSNMLLAVSPELAAVSTLMLCFVLSIAAMVHLMRRRQDTV